MAEPGGRHVLVLASLTETTTANYFVRALKRAGHRTFAYSDVPSPNADAVGPGACHIKQVMAQCGWTPDLVLFIEGGTMQLLPAGLSDLSCLTAWYGIDTHVNYAKHLRVARLFDVTFLAQQKFVPVLRTDGIRQVFWLPLACPVDLLPPAPVSRDLDWAYVGTSNAQAYPERARLLQVLRGRWSNCYVGAATPPRMMDLYGRAKVVFNRSLASDVNMRVFEATGAGAALLTDRIEGNGMDALFTAGRELVEYADEPSLLDAMSRLLGDDAWRESIASAGRAAVMNRHTYDHRVTELLEQAAGCEKAARATADEYFAAYAYSSMPGEALAAAAQVFGALPAGGARRWAHAAIARCMRLLGWCVGAGLRLAESARAGARRAR